MQHWYVYYKLPRAEREVSIAQVRQMQQDVARASTVRMLLLERADQSKQHETTMMEVYEDIEQPEHFAAVLDDAVRRSGLSAALVAARRVERFQDI